VAAVATPNARPLALTTDGDRVSATKRDAERVGVVPVPDVEGRGQLRRRARRNAVGGL
jgi:hypothetical protein